MSFTSKRIFLKVVLGLSWFLLGLQRARECLPCGPKMRGQCSPLGSLCAASAHPIPRLHGAWSCVHTCPDTLRVVRGLGEKGQRQSLGQGRAGPWSGSLQGVCRDPSQGDSRGNTE